MKIAIVAVHGVIPQIRHGFQDEVAATLCDALNKQHNGKTWAMTVVLPRNRTSDASDIPTIARVHVATDAADAPQEDFFDVHEAFWSPIDKGKTTLPKVLTWLLTTVFLPFNDFASYRERPGKVCWDICYIGTAIAIGITALVLAALMSGEAMRDVVCLVSPNPALKLQISCQHLHLLHAYKHIFDRAAWQRAFSTLAAMIAFVLSPLKVLDLLQPKAIVGLISGVIGAYLAWQVMRATTFIVTNVVQFLQRDPVQLISRAIWTVFLAAFASLFLVIDGKMIPPPSDSHWSFVGIYLVLSVGLFNFGRSYLTWFVVNFFGDVQIYTTRDQNSEFFSLREQILEKVVNVILDVVANAPAGIPYDRVYILAHSLGSTISMDAILRLYDMKSASVGLRKPPLSELDWNRIRGFITFGTSLEKTKYFFNVWNATPSQDWEQWNAAIYGSVFTAESFALSKPSGSLGIYWHNNWFFSDFVSDRICTYRSFLRPGEPVWKNPAAMASLKGNGSAFIGRLVAFNRGRFGPFPRSLQTHTKYLESYWFWHPALPGDIGVIDVLTSGVVGIAPTKPHRRSVLGVPSSTPPTSPPLARGEPIPAWAAKFRKSWEVVK
jgi:hypothetical protein